MALDNHPCDPKSGNENLLSQLRSPILSQSRYQLEDVGQETRGLFSITTDFCSNYGNQQSGTLLNEHHYIKVAFDTVKLSGAITKRGTILAFTTLISLILKIRGEVE